MRQKIKEKIKIIFGIACIALGFFALITPLTPGSWLIFIGAEILGIQFLSRGKLAELYRRGIDFFKTRFKNIKNE